jgi:F0F1-type ATP synthase delta subunit
LQFKNNQFDGFIYTAGDVNSETIQELTKNIEQKTNAKINFKLQKDEIDGFKVEVPDLGIEASFSNDRLKQQLISHILRGI